MDFWYETSIRVEEYELEEMANRVSAGEDFVDVYMDISCGWDDKFFYNRHEIEEQVEQEILKRIKNKA